MTVFRWLEAWHDIALAKNVICFRPTKPVDWDEIAAKLSEAFSAAKGKLVELKGRGCRERMDIRNALWKSFKLVAILLYTYLFGPFLVSLPFVVLDIKTKYNIFTCP